MFGNKPVALKTRLVIVGVIPFVEVHQFQQRFDDLIHSFCVKRLNKVLLH